MSRADDPAIVEIVGRDVELGSIREFTASLAHEPAALVIHGAAGLGKTTLWTSGLAEARERGCRVLEARPAETEAALSFSAIGDLFEPVLEQVLSCASSGPHRAVRPGHGAAESSSPPAGVR